MQLHYIVMQKIIVSVVKPGRETCSLFFHVNTVFNSINLEGMPSLYTDYAICKRTSWEIQTKHRVNFSFFLSVKNVLGDGLEHDPAHYGEYHNCVIRQKRRDNQNFIHEPVTILL